MPVPPMKRTFMSCNTVDKTRCQVEPPLERSAFTPRAARIASRPTVPFERDYYVTGELLRCNNLFMNHETVVINSAFVRAFASDWIEAWNARDLDRVLTLYTDDFEMDSPL